MTFQPDPQDSIYIRIRDAIASASDITNFSDNSPEKAITDDGFAGEYRRRQHEALSIQLSSRIDYAGKTITEDDLSDLNLDVDTIDLDLLNSFVEDSDLDEKVREYGLERDPGAFATGEVTFTTQNDTVTIDGGTEVSTGGDNSLIYTTDQSVSPSSGNAEVTVSITAEERGANYNVGPDEVTALPSPPPGVTAVANKNKITGGEDEETNQELRSRAKNALITSSDGGTVGGVRGGLVEAFDGLTLGDVIVKQYFDPSTSNGDRQDSPYAEVVVNGGGTDSEVEAEIDTLRPTAINHYLVRPSEVTVSINVTLTGTDVNTTDVKDAVEKYIRDQGIGENITRDRITFLILDADSGIDTIDQLTMTVTGESHLYDSNSTNHPLYKLDKDDAMAPDGSSRGNGITKIVDEHGNEYTEGTDFDEATIDGSSPDGLDWSIGGTNPAEGDEFMVDYDIEDDIPIKDTEETLSGAVRVMVN